MTTDQTPNEPPEPTFLSYPMKFVNDRPDNETWYMMPLPKADETVGKIDESPDDLERIRKSKGQ